jgi:hypothetical protein
MFKVRVLSKCLRCNGEAYLPIDECEDSQGRTYTRYAPCLTCEGSGNQPQWVILDEFAKLLHHLIAHLSTHSSGGICVLSQVMSGMT